MSEELGQNADNGDTPTLVRAESAEALRELLDALNESDCDHRAVGMDARGEPFLIALSGPYADSEVVLYGNPWDGEVDYGTGPSCVECMAQRPHTMSSLHFPVHLVMAPTEDGVRTPVLPTSPDDTSSSVPTIGD